MENNSKKTTEAGKIKEGCGKEFELLENPKVYIKCNELDLCPICQAKLSQYKSDLQQELEFLENQIKNVRRHKSCVSCFRLLRTSEERINFIKKELKEIETCQ